MDKFLQQADVMATHQYKSVNVELQLDDAISPLCGAAFIITTVTDIHIKEYSI